MGNSTTHLLPVVILTRDEQESVRIAEIISSSLSIVGAGSIICVAIVKKKVFNVEVHPLFHLSMADLLAAVFVIAGLIVYGQEINNAPYVCYWVTGLAVGLYLSTFMLTFVYALEAYVRTKEQLDRKRTTKDDRKPVDVCNPWYMGLVYTVAWALPIFMVIGVVIGTQKASSNVPEICTRYHYGMLRSKVKLGKKSKLSRDRTKDAVNARLALKSFFLFVLVAVTIGLFVLYTLTHRTLRRSQNLQGIIGPRQYDEARKVRNRSIIYCSVFIICWLPALIMGLLSYSNQVDLRDVFWLYMLQSIMAPLQGFLNCLIYGWIRGSFHRALNIGSDINALSFSIARRYSQITESPRFADYGTLSATDDDYDVLSDARATSDNKIGITMTTSGSGGE